MATEPMTANELVPESVLAAFDLSGPGERLTGGAGLCVRVGAAVFKPAEDTAETRWTAELLTGLAVDGFRLARPIRARDGQWVVDGWSASRFVAGEQSPIGSWRELFAAAGTFHAALGSAQRPTFLDGRTHRWARADRVAWAEETLVTEPEVAPLMRRLEAMRHPIRPECQLVHGDLCGNVLFADGHPPAIIDFSPYWRPVGYAEAIIAVDGLLWFDADLDVLTLVDPQPDLRQLLVRALIFRLVALNLRPVAGDDDGRRDELASFAKVISEVERL